MELFAVTNTSDAVYTDSRMSLPPGFTCLFDDPTYGETLVADFPDVFEEFTTPWDVFNGNEFLGFYVPFKALVAPDTLALDDAVAGELALSWEDTNDGECKYEIWRSPSDNTAYVLKGLTAWGAVSYVDDYLPEGDVFYYKVRGVRFGVASDFCDEAFETVAAVGP